VQCIVHHLERAYCVWCRPVTSLGHQVGQRVFWEGPKFFNLCPIVLNYVQRMGGRKILQESSPPWLQTWCDVKIARSCGTLSAFAAIIFLLALDCAMQLWIRVRLKATVYLSFKLDSDLAIRIQRKSCSDTTTSFFVLQNQLINKACLQFTAGGWTSGVDFILASRLKVIASFSGH